MDLAAQQTLYSIGRARLEAVKAALLQGPEHDAAPTTVLGDGTAGYYMRRGDDCWPAAIATVTQVPLDEVPDLRLDEQVELGQDPAEVELWAWQTVEDWCSDQALRMVLHTQLPARRRRWIGVVPVPDTSNPTA